jgi:hypothetical protein
MRRPNPVGVVLSRTWTHSADMYNLMPEMDASSICDRDVDSDHVDRSGGVTS